MDFLKVSTRKLKQNIAINLVFLIKLFQLRFYLSVMLENSKKGYQACPYIPSKKSRHFRESQKIQVFLPCGEEATSHGLIILL